MSDRYELDEHGDFYNTKSGNFMLYEEVASRLNQLEKHLAEYESGHKGACSTCEAVGILNQKLEKQLEIAEDALKFYDSIHRLNWAYDLSRPAKEAKKALEQIEQIAGNSEVIGREEHALKNENLVHIKNKGTKNE